MPRAQRIVVDYDVDATMRDGTVLRADVMRPDRPGPLPVLLCRTPYGKAGAFFGPFLDGPAMARRGYLVVAQDVRGTGRSGGRWEPFVHEIDDGADTVRWAASLARSSGAVGMFGPSYLGYTQWAAAISRPEPLRALVPALTWSDAANGLLRRGGAPETGCTNYLHHYGFAAAVDVRIVDALAACRPDGAEITNPLLDLDPVDCSIPGRHPDPAPAVAALGVAGWYDLFLAGTLDHFRRSRAGDRGTRLSRLVVGPWSHVNFGGHSGAHSFGQSAAFSELAGVGLAGLATQWFDHHLLGRPFEHPWLTGPPVRAFDMGTNEWVAHTDWPPPGAVPTDLALRPSSPRTRLVEIGTAPPGRRAWPGGAIHMHPTHPAGVVRREPGAVEDAARVLAMVTDVCTEPMTLAGPIDVVVTVRDLVGMVDLVARLLLVQTDGSVRNLADGVQRVDAADTVVAHLDLWSTYVTVQAGERLLLEVGGAAWPRWGSPAGGRLVLSPESVGLTAHVMCSR